MPVVVDILVGKKEETVLGEVGNLDIKLNDKVILEIDEAFDIGLVISKERLIEKPKEHVYKIIRKFTQDDYRRIEENKKRSENALRIIQDKIKNYEFNIKLTHVEYTFDRTKLYIYYTSETRIDFRDFVKDLGHTLKTRIQMVQIGVRDETKILGGLGHCGRVLCCKTFLKNFESVTIDMAKQQNLALNTAKLSGVCGRLMCCLAYENQLYYELSKNIPKIKSKVLTPEGPGVVTDLNILKQEITVELEDKKIRKFTVDKIQKT